MDKNMTRQIAWVVTVLVLVLAAAFLGVKYPLPAQPELVAETSRVAGANVTTEKALVVQNYIKDQGTLEVAGASTLSGALTMGGAVTVGDGGDTVAVNSSDWDISTTGAMTGIGAITSDGALTAASGVITGALTVGGYPPVVSTLATNSIGITNSVWSASNAVVWEGSAADSYETSIVATNATAARTITLPDASGVPILTGGVPGAGQAWDVGAYEWHYEGTTDDTSEITVRFPANPTADYVYVWPEFGGYVGLNQADSLMTVHGSSVVTGTATLTHSLGTPLYAFCTMGTDPVDDQEDRCTVTISGATVTAKVWKEAATPTAGDSGVTVYWAVVGTP